MSGKGLTDAMAALPLLPRDEEGPVFAEPWQAQVFALVVQLCERGELTWQDWAERLGAEFTAAEERGQFDTGERYYDHWLNALERLTIDRKLAARNELAAEKESIREHDHHRREKQIHQH